MEFYRVDELDHENFIIRMQRIEQDSFERARRQLEPVLSRSGSIAALYNLELPKGF